MTGRMQKHLDAILSYFPFSSVYGSIGLSLLDWFWQDEVTDPMGVDLWFLLIFLGPMALGISLGLTSKTEIIRRFLHKIGINLVHVMPTAWDWKFGNTKDHLVLVTLKDDTKLAGYCGRKSFMSSDPSKRGIYIKKYTVGGTMIAGPMEGSAAYGSRLAKFDQLSFFL